MTAYVRKQQKKRCRTSCGGDIKRLQSSFLFSGIIISFNEIKLNFMAKMVQLARCGQAHARENKAGSNLLLSMTLWSAVEKCFVSSDISNQSIVTMTTNTKTRCDVIKLIIYCNLMLRHTKAELIELMAKPHFFFYIICIWKSLEF